MRRFNDLTGKLFVSLKVVAYAGTDRHGRRKWRVCCARCGDEKIVLAANLLAGLKISGRTSGRTTTCGCAQRKKARQRMRGLPASGQSDRSRRNGKASRGKAQTSIWTDLRPKFRAREQVMVRLLPSRSRVHAATAQQDSSFWLGGSDERTSVRPNYLTQGLSLMNGTGSPSPQCGAHPLVPSLKAVSASM